MSLEITRATLEIFSKLEKKWLSHHESGKKTRVLSIDGGGTTATVSGALLICLEEQIQAKTGDSNARIIDFFDIIAGTGIGALLAVLINADDGNGRPMFTASEAVKLVTNNRTELYKSKTVGVFRRKRMFSSSSMNNVLRKMLTRDDGNVLTLTDMCKPLLIPCFDLNSSAPFVFSRADALSSSYNFELWKVIRATSCDPSMFKPFPLTSVDGKTSCVAIDGGLVTNNPTSIAITHVLNNKRDFPLVNGIEDLVVISIGNGLLCNSPIRKLNRYGRCMTSSVVDIALDGISENVDQMLSNAFCWNQKDYLRVQSNCYMMEGVGPKMAELLMEKGVESLPFGAKRLLTETNGKRIENFVRRLVALRRNSLPPSPCKDTSVSLLVHGR
ncbi:probable inactive patatin-like protein 9 [Rutidosis leptorrhynchoides]|uniref:probable inactive patatin-like protein 9 n=1 Tax=Rutidosis leptorrhynchoides TaxID=125765 RepID=UPI003A99386F